MARGTQERGATRAETTTGRGNGSPAARDTVARQREEHGGINWGSAFFGWLTAIGIAALLTAILSAAGTAGGVAETGPSQAPNPGSTHAGTGGVVGGVGLVGVFRGRG